MTGAGAKTEKGEKKRTDVLNAALRLLAREGPRAVTHRAVAAEAKTSVRGITYYFASREDLLTEALVHYANEAVARFDSIRAPLSGGSPAEIADLAADLLAATVMSDVEGDRVGLVAEYELVLEIGRNPAIEPAYQMFQRTLLDILAGYADVMGSEDPNSDARLVLATLRGLELEALASPSKKPRHDDLRHMFQRLLRSVIGDRRRGTKPERTKVTKTGK
jgi:TetR/AcrR family transcriptional regulator, regulator of biofilm formation and stress response